MWIMLAGRYSAPTAVERKANLDALNATALAVYARGHLPVIGLNNALPLFGEDTTDRTRNADVMRVSLALAERCDAILMVSHSGGADREMDLFRAAAKPVFERMDDIPPAHPSV